MQKFSEICERLFGGITDSFLKFMTEIGKEFGKIIQEALTTLL